MSNILELIENKLESAQSDLAACDRKDTTKSTLIRGEIMAYTDLITYIRGHKMSLEELFVDEYKKAVKKIDELEKKVKLLEIDKQMLKTELDLQTGGKWQDNIKKEFRA